VVILAGTLNGANFGRDVVDFNADSKSTTNTGHFVIALNIEAFADTNHFKAGIDKVWEEMKSSPTLPAIGDALQTTLLTLAKQLKVEPLSTD